MSSKITYNFPSEFFTPAPESARAQADGKNTSIIQDQKSTSIIQDQKSTSIVQPHLNGQMTLNGTPDTETENTYSIKYLIGAAAAALIIGVGIGYFIPHKK